MDIAVLMLQVARILERYRRQNGFAPLNDVTARKIGERLIRTIEERGLPRCLRPEEMGEPGEIAADEVAPLVKRVVGNEQTEGLDDVVRQLVKACFYPEFKKCRDSYREVEATGGCRRQTLAKANGRVSGAHCVDCPYWIGLTESQHEALLASAWVGDRNEFRKHREIFLPEDFREFRRMIRHWAAEDSSKDST